MKVTVFRDERTLARTLAVQIAATLGQHPATVLGLPTGRTPIRLYHELGSLHANGQADFSRAATFNLDEFLGVSAHDGGSYRAFMEDHLFSRVNLQPDRINFLDGAAPDPEAECARYVVDRKIDVDSLFTHRWKLDQAAEAYRLFATHTTGKGVFVM